MNFSIPAAKLLAAFLLIPAAAVAQGSCSVVNDPCPFQFDLFCDDPTGSNWCPANSDCADCDPLMLFRNQGCEVCVANGGRYCEVGDGTRVCSSPQIAAAIPNACSATAFGGTQYMSTCNGDSPVSDDDDESSGGLAALSVLVLIPIAGLGYFIYGYYYRKRSAGEGLNGKQDGNGQEGTANNNAGNHVIQSEDRQPWLSSRNDASRVPQPPAEQSSHGGGYLPTNKDQPQTYFSPQAQSFATHGSDSGFPSDAPPSRVRQDPPADPPSNPPAPAKSTHEGPDVKDQCREVIVERQSSGPPLAHAIIIEPSDVKGGIDRV